MSKLSYEQRLDRFNQIIKIINDKNGICLSEFSEFNKTTDRIKIKCCECSHIWSPISRTIISGCWCPKCAGQLKTIADMYLLATKNNGKCLSNKYEGDGCKLLWECELGHSWLAVPSHIIQGTWCPDCSRIRNGIKNTKWTLAMAKELALTKGGICLATEVKNSNTKIQWRCNCDYQWAASIETIKNHWCPKCGGNAPKNINDMHELASIYGGKCLSLEYINSFTKLHWQCSLNHDWWSTPSNVYWGYWCSDCAGVSKYSIEDMQLLAKSRDGRCLSTVYENVHSKIEWQCGKLHSWFAVPDSILRGTWCPYCQKSKTEKLCREIFEEYYNDKFPTIKASWIPGVTGYPLELDGYCAGLGLAFEYNGAQHYRPGVFGGTLDDFKEQQIRDKIKIDFCQKFGVKLFIIEEIEYSTKEKVQKIILEKIKMYEQSNQLRKK